ncbi:M15 family metallopeptidase [Hyunsoonleella pacifica]|uniref:D-alanyl-D-alanine dipeptidase n=1 Tax=Hyunsoonleella pacifica TaxID=1080224 RepID=A0A4Q9FRS6_9FLAO|nr:M15 family metallopeptidase [Hyunsoonleella pacifica]TBN18496.1 peptidase M15 [Hyunsoonleella pacifica]GGD02224.1 D-alanyl-D-alanine dipeptidase [Hyunsoonleella pacifica]
MKQYLVFLFLLHVFSGHSQLPDGFIYANSLITDLEVELKYLGTDNFVGQPIDGYNNNCLILTEETVVALKKVQKELKKQNLGIKVYDGYRPQRAVNHFIRWARDLNDTINKAKFYPNVKKSDLFKEEYIASRSGHTKGSTVDITIINIETKQELDMGSIFDFFGVQSWVNYKDITKEQKLNREFLQTIMLKHGFKNYPREWWHFTLKEEPFPNTYFDFPIE